MELHLRYRRLTAEYNEGTKHPFMVIASASDGHDYEVPEVEVMRARCAKWHKSEFEYVEEYERYRRETWTGPGVGIAFVTSDEARIR